MQVLHGLSALADDALWPLPQCQTPGKESDAVLLLPLLPFPLPLHLPLPLPLPLPSSFLVIKMKSRQPVEG